MAKPRSQNWPLDADIKAMSQAEAKVEWEKVSYGTEEFDKLIAERDAIQRKLVRLRVRQHMYLCRALGQDTILVDRDDIPALEEKLNESGTTNPAHGAA
jgi:hypothetical protein